MINFSTLQYLIVGGVVFQFLKKKKILFITTTLWFSIWYKKKLKFLAQIAPKMHFLAYFWRRENMVALIGWKMYYFRRIFTRLQQRHYLAPNPNICDLEDGNMSWYIPFRFALSRARSKAFAEKNNFPDYVHVLHPRVTGFTFFVEQLREAHLDAVYDVTFGYAGGLCYSEKDLLRGSVCLSSPRPMWLLCCCHSIYMYLFR